MSGEPLRRKGRGRDTLRKMKKREQLDLGLAGDKRKPTGPGERTLGVTCANCRREPAQSSSGRLEVSAGGHSRIGKAAPTVEKFGGQR